MSTRCLKHSLKLKFHTLICHADKEKHFDIIAQPPISTAWGDNDWRDQRATILAITHDLSVAPAPSTEPCAWRARLQHSRSSRFGRFCSCSGPTVRVSAGSRAWRSQKSVPETRRTASQKSGYPNTRAERGAPSRSGPSLQPELGSTQLDSMFGKPAVDKQLANKPLVTIIGVSSVSCFAATTQVLAQNASYIWFAQAGKPTQT